MMFRNTYYNLRQLAPVLRDSTPGMELSPASKGGLVDILSDGLEHPLLIVKKVALNMSTVSIHNNLFGNMERNREICDRLITSLNDLAANPPHHPRLNLGEGASYCMTLLPAEAQEVKPEIDAGLDLVDRITEIIQQGYHSTYRPVLFFAAHEMEFREKMEQHTKARGDNLHYQVNLPGARDAHYSNALKTCLIGPGLIEILEGRKGSHGSKLRVFERILHEVTHGMIDEVQGGRNILSYPLEEYIVTMAAHQLTADYAHEIAGDEIDPDQYKDFLVEGRVSFLPPNHEQRKTVYFRNETRQYHKQIARYFMSKVSSLEGLNELNVLGE